MAQYWENYWNGVNQMSNEHKIGLSNPFNYTGSKHRYLKDLLEILPQENDLTVLDPFFGGGDLSMHLNETWSITGGDCCEQLIKMHNLVKSGGITADLIAKIYKDRSLSKENYKAFIDLRNEYNESKDPVLLYLLLTSSFNNQMRFNKSGGFNMPFGKNRSSFNPRMKAKLNDYSLRLAKRRVSMSVKSFTDHNFSEFDLLLIDPPYINTTATYNESGGWNESLDIDLLSKIDAANKVGVKFVYFNQMFSKDALNNNLYQWSKKYNIKVLKDTTKNCSSNRKGGKTVEVMIWNF
jgi:DNA adenine methylase